MFLNLNPKTWLLSIALPLLATSSCRDDKATQIAREAADRQAQQNTAMAELNKEVASGSHELVEADAQARQEFVGVHHDLQSERTRLDTGWNELEDERRQIAGQRRTESTLASLTSIFGGGLVVVVLLGFCWYVLVASRRGDDADAQLNELLIREILPDEPPLLGSDHRSPALLGQSHPNAGSD